MTDHMTRGPTTLVMLETSMTGNVGTAAEVVDMMTVTGTETTTGTNTVTTETDTATTGTDIVMTGDTMTDGTDWSSV
jgi:hypothetical protein